ncbi:MAG: CHASE domain-containing protein [Aquabacterium sp.]|nr:CHASE domain-containing protein [Aquabacterium sp.]
MPAIPRIFMLPKGVALSAAQRVMLAVVVVLGLTLSAMSYYWLKDVAYKAGAAQFERSAEKMDAEVVNRFDSILRIFGGLRSFMHAHEGGDVSRDAFRIWVASNRTRQDAKLVRGVGLIERVDRADLTQFIDAQRADGAPSFKVRSTGDAADLFVIKQIEPLSGNEKAWGFDVGSEPVRREAAVRAVATGLPALTSRIVLVQDSKKRAGYLYYQPVFRWASKVDTPADRQRNLIGLVYSPVVIDELFDGVGVQADNLLDLEVFDGEGTAAAQVVLDMGMSLKASAGGFVRQFGAYAVVRKLDIGGHTLTLKFRSTPQFDQRHQNGSALWLAMGGGVLTMLLSFVLWLLMVGRAHAEAIAQRMTADLSDAKHRAEGALRDQTLLLSTLGKFSLVSVADLAGKILEVNEAFCLRSGYSADELIGQNHRIVNSGTHEPAFFADMWQAIGSSKAWHGEVCNRAKDGSLYWVNSMIVPMLGADGQIDKYVSICNDITESKLNESKLINMAERYQLAIDGGTDGLWDWLNVNDHKMWWSPQFYKMMGYEPDEIQGSLDAFEQLLHPDNQEEVLKIIEGALKKYRPFDTMCRMRMKSGVYRWLRFRGKVYFDKEGFATRMAGSMQDVHERCLAEEVIQKHSEQLSAIFSLSPDGFVSFGANKQVNYASAAYGTLTDLSAESVLCLDEDEFLAQLLGQCVNPPELTSLDALLDVPAHTDKMSWLARHRLVLEMKVPAGRMLALSLYETQGESVSRLLLVHDVTHEAEVDRIKSEFLSMAAHELRTPMASIYGFVDLMLTRDLKPEKQKDLMGKVHRQCEVMIALINELLELARIENRGASDFDCTSVDMGPIVADVVRDFNLPAGREAPEVGPQLSTARVAADPHKFGQAFLNVLSNAYKYSPRGGAVRVTYPVRTGDDGVAWRGVQVSDSGIGMSPEQLMHVGERFFRADKSGNIPGTGLGVSIVKEIMELMDGELTVDSELGQGTTVTLWLRVLSQLEHTLD